MRKSRIYEEEYDDPFFHEEEAESYPNQVQGQNLGFQQEEDGYIEDDDAEDLLLE